MVQENPIQTSEEVSEKLPVDFADTDEHGNVQIPSKEKEATTESKEAQVKEADKGKIPTKTFTEPELKKRIDSAVAGHKGTITKMRTDYDALKKQFDALQSQFDDRELTGWLSQVEKTGGDVDFAKTVIERDRQNRQISRQLEQLKSELDTKEAILNEAGKTKQAYDLAKQYELDEDAINELLTSKNDLEMENKALKFHLEKSKAKATLAESPPKLRGTPQGIDRSKMNITERLGLAAEGKI